MNYEPTELRKNVRDGFRVLLSAEIRLLLPEGKEKMREYYSALGETCLSWATEILGERLKEEYRELKSVREKARFRSVRYRVRMRETFSDGGLAALLCESELTGTQTSRRATAGVWNLAEETLLPGEQVLRTFGVKIGKKKMPFVPDGFYPEGERIVLFRNGDEHAAFLEESVPFGSAPDIN